VESDPKKVSFQVLKEDPDPEEAMETVPCPKTAPPIASNSAERVKAGFPLRKTTALASAVVIRSKAAPD